MRMKMEKDFTEILDDASVEQLQKSSVCKPKKNFWKIKIGLFVFLLGVLLLHSFEMRKISAAIQSSSLDVAKDDLYTYSKIEFSEVDLSSIVNVWDYDEDGIDDHTDILLGARAFVNTKPKYVSEYYAGGYPPEGVGVCTDVVIYGFLNAGYDLQELVDTDIRIHRKDYSHIETVDKNIDYRRVDNLQIFFNRYATVLTNDIVNPDDWQAGDIVVFPHHIGVLSDKKNEKGYPYIIHHGGQKNYEEDVLEISMVIGHYRWH